MTYSLGEVEALCKKATRGAGLSWGLAEDAAKSVRWLCSWGLPGVHVLARYLEDRTDDTGPTHPTAMTWSAAGQLCPIICATLLSDMGSQALERRLMHVRWPLLLLPYGVGPLAISWGTTRIDVTDHVTISGTLTSPLADEVTVTRKTDTGGRPCSRSLRAEIAEADLDALTRLAARTYAPETETSKLTGAGAGLQDTD
ncbi:MAG: DUF3726 domain-containing protein [Pseudomonadota bacterium]